MDEAAVEALVKDGELLELLLARNKSQHRRTDYFRALTGCVSALRRLHPVALTELAQRVALAESGSARTHGGDSWNARDEEKSESKKGLAVAITGVDGALVAATDLARHLRRTTRLLRQQVSAGYFLALTVAWVAIIARLLAAARAVALCLLSLRRSLAMVVGVGVGALNQPPQLTRPPLVGILEWLVSYHGGAHNSAKGSKERNVGASTSSHREARKIGEKPQENSLADQAEDIGERVLFAETVTASFKNAQSMEATLDPSSSKASERLLLADEYSESEDDDDAGGGNISAVNEAREEASGWYLDVHGSSSSSSSRINQGFQELNMKIQLPDELDFFRDTKYESSAGADSAPANRYSQDGMTATADATVSPKRGQKRKKSSNIGQADKDRSGSSHLISSGIHDAIIQFAGKGGGPKADTTVVTSKKKKKNSKKKKGNTKGQAAMGRENVDRAPCGDVGRGGKVKDSDGDGDEIDDIFAGFL